MDWVRAIEINRVALARIVAGLFAMAGLTVGGALERLPQAVRLAVLKILRPAESAVRRLIVVAAHGLVVKPAARQPMPAGLALGARGSATATRRPAFQLFDPRLRFDRSGQRRGPSGPPPQLTIYGFDPRIPLFRNALTLAPPEPAVAPPGDAHIDIGLGRRLAAIHAALADLPKQARRLTRWRARRLRLPQAKFREPLRAGPPPGQGRSPGIEVHAILRECHGLARDLPPPDSS